MNKFLIMIFVIGINLITIGIISFELEYLKMRDCDLLIGIGLILIAYSIFVYMLTSIFEKEIIIEPQQEEIDYTDS